VISSLTKNMQKNSKKDHDLRYERHDLKSLTTRDTLISLSHLRRFHKKFTKILNEKT
jgi:hypothetical protein